jgi:TPR repeat protein
MQSESSLGAPRALVLAASLALSLAACSDVDRTRWSARFGSAESQHVMGMRHQAGRGVEEDLGVAIEWFEQAAEQGHTSSRNRLVEIYDERDAPGDAELALHWLQELAESDDPEGQFRYGRRLMEGGEGLAGAGWVERAAEAGYPPAQVVAARGMLREGERTQAVVLLQKAAREGDPDAAFELAKLAEDGVVSMSDEEIDALVRAAAENGHPGAQFILAERLTNGTEETDFAKAAQWYRLAAEQAFAPAQEAMGILYDSGQGVTEDPLEAARWYRLAAEQGRAAAENQLGRLYARGRLPDEETAQQIAFFSAAKGDNSEQLEEYAVVARKNNDRKAVEWYRRAIAKDFPAAMINLAGMIEKDRVPDAEPEEAVALYQRAAELGDPTAQSLLASRYATGEGGVEQDASASLAMLEAAAKSGHGPAQISLASLYYRGIDGEPDLEKSAYWFGKAVDSGVEEAEATYAAMLASGIGTPRNEERARILFEKAAERGDPNAEYSLGVFHEEGRGGLPVNLAQAVMWWKRAAKQGQGAAQAKLGIALVRGDGVTPNIVEAYAWLSASGVKETKPWVEAIEKEMPAAMRLQAQKLAEERRELRVAAEESSSTAPRIQ